MLPVVSKKTVSLSKALTLSNQSLIENNILIPDSKPDIKKVIRVSSAVTDLTTKTSNDEIILEGTLSETLLYSGENSPNPCTAIKENVNFKETFYAPNITSDMKIFAYPQIEFVEHSILNERKVNVRNIVNFNFIAFEEKQKDVVSETDDPNMQSLSSEKLISSPADVINETVNISEEILIPSKNPEIAELLTWDVSISDKEIRCLNGKIQIKGTLLCDILYNSDPESLSPEFFKAEIPLNGYLENPNSSEDMQIFGKISPKNIYLRAIPDDEENMRKIEADISIASALMLIEQKSESITEDAYSLAAPISAQTEEMEFSTILPTVSTLFTVNNTVTLDDGEPSILRILNIWPYITIDDTIVEENKVTLDGDIVLDVLYVGEDDSLPFNLFEAHIPFRQEVAINGAEPGQVAYISSDVENVAFNLLTNREVEFNASAALDITLIRNNLSSFLTDITENAEAPSGTGLSSAVIYIVQPGDSLWKISKKFGTTIESLVNLNSIENPNLIYPGERLLITRKILFE